ncbi:MAG: hypothetical protein JJ858_13815 [Rhizobiaceae bacterium]|nr:hypothetical protein [Rhizobiaceae bacterium]
MNDYLGLIRKSFENSLARRFVFITLLCSSILAVFITCVQLFIDFQNEQRSLDNSIRKVETAIVPSLTESLWALDDILVQSQLTGITNVDGVLFAKLTDSDGRVLNAGDQAQPASETHDFVLVKDNSGDETKVGELAIGITYEHIFEELFNRAVIIFLTNMLKTLMVACILLVIYQLLIGRHLSDITRFATDYDPNEAERKFKLNRNTNYSDEFTKLEHAINSWVETNLTHVEKLKLANERIQNVNKELSTFTYSLSHDLKSPINTVNVLLTEAMKSSQEKQSDEFNFLMETALKTNRRMGNIIDDTLQYARANEETTIDEAVDSNAIMREILNDLNGEISSANADVQVDELPLIKGNPVLVRTLLQNLVSNAIKFRAANRTPIIKLTSDDAEDGYCEIRIEDNGIGIDPRYHHKIFKQFEKLHTYNEYPGTGLGLSVCRKIVDKLNGTIDLFSKENEGTTFTVKLKVA